MNPREVRGAVERAAEILRASVGDRLRPGFVLAPLTTLRIGGPADLFLEPQSEEDLRTVARAHRETALPVTTIGKGSNVLIGDGGIRGIVLRLGKGFRFAARDGNRLTGGGSMPLPALAGVALSHALAGLEFGVAIPATLGGAVRMNAGAHGHEMQEVIERIDVFDLEASTVVPVPAAEAGFAYRTAELPASGVIVGAVARLGSGDPTQIRAHMDEARDWRRRTQPLAEPNCGSVFKNPPGDHAARLVEEAGGKGVKVGGASVSRKHANFIVAEPGTRARDVLELIRSIQDLVAAHSGVTLETEVHRVGDLDPATG
ncbi:MAG: UDP-N-acetylmuramate dehydrogenase [Actinomycetota bacterium]